LSKTHSTIRERAQQNKYDAVIVGSGPNALSAAIVFATHGCSTLVVEAQPTAGGGCRSLELTEPGFVHDICSSIHPLGIGSPYFRTLPLEKFGLQWIHPQAPFAHPFDEGEAVLVERSIDETAKNLGEDGDLYQRFAGALLPNWDELCAVLLRPLSMLEYPLPLAKFGIRALMPATLLAKTTFKGRLAQGMFAGIAAHSSLPLESIASASFGLVLGLAAHAVGWPMPKGGAQKLSDALISYLMSLGGEIILGTAVNSLDDLPESRFVLCDITPRQLLAIAGDKLTASYRESLERYRYGPASFKMDFALDGPIPWANEQCLRAATVHLGGTLEEIALSEHEVNQGRTPAFPYVLLAQTSLFDPTRAPAGKHTVWAYCHTPNGSTEDMASRIEGQIERFAPGFKRKIIKCNKISPAKMHEHNANYIGGDINGGALSLSQLFTRPVARPIPYSTPAKGLYLCSSSTPPGGGVHGMCGYYAAHAALKGLQ
jgi:phytoene dehydrogenase-like protein